MRSQIRWGRVIVAALLSEIAVMVVMMAVGGVYMLVTHSRTAADLQQFGERMGYYVAPPAAGLFTFLSAFWATRKLTANMVLNGVLVGVAAVILTAGFLFTARPEDRLMYVVSFAIRIVAGYLAGLTAQARFNRTRSAVSPVAG